MYINDCLILYNHKNEINLLLNIYKKILSNLGLRLNDNKTVIVKSFKNGSFKYLGMKLKLYKSITN